MSIRTVTLRRVLRAVLIAFVGLCEFARAAGEIRWRRVPTHGAEFGLTAIAFDPESARIAVGSSRGLYAGDSRGVFDLVEAHSEVRELAFRDAAGEGPVLFAATNRGVYRFTEEGHSGPIAPGPAAGARDIYRVAISRRGGGVAVATTGGAFLSRDGIHWDRLSPTHPIGPVRAIAIRAHGVEGRGFECFTLADGTLWRTVIAASAEEGATRTRRETIPFAPRGNARDVVVGLPGSDLVVVYESVLAVHRDAAKGSDPAAGSRSQPARAASATSGWEILRPTLPPGARITRLAAALGRIWLATDRGLLVADRLAGPWRRAGAPAGTVGVRALVGDAESLLIVSETRLLRAEIPEVGVSEGRSAAPTLKWEAEPRLPDLHRAAITHLSLGRDRIESMRSRVRKRGWLPIVSVRGEYGTDKDWGTDRDQTFTSGRLHNLVDSESDYSTDADVSLALAWDFGDVVYHPEEIDVSREVRSLLAFRDDVLDELTQLYFDRKRALLQRAALPPNSTEAQQLQLRAEELAAGMDGWTGGWFSRALDRSLP